MSSSKNSNNVLVERRLSTSGIANGEGTSYSLRWKQAVDENSSSPINTYQHLAHQAVTAPPKSLLRNHSPHTRYCPAGHVLANNIPVLQRQRFLQRHLQKLDGSVLPVVGCDGCSKDIVAETDSRIGATCAVCDLDFCQSCYWNSGKSIQELLQDARLATTSAATGKATSASSVSSSSVEASLTSFVSTQEYCVAGHELVEVSTIVRQRHLQERDQLEVMPMIECDCCSKEIRDEFIAGCDVVCDIDICKDCFKNGQSFEDVLGERRKQSEVCGDNDDNNNSKAFLDARRQRYNGRRPTYRGTGRVTYDDYPDPTVYQWKFTGSSKSRPIEYFEKDFGSEIGVVLLDMYYTQGTVETSLVHPIKGERILFTTVERISSQSYHKILKEPCFHNKRRYKPVSKTGKLLL